MVASGADERLLKSRVENAMAKVVEMIAINAGAVCATPEGSNFCVSKVSSTRNIDQI